MRAQRLLARCAAVISLVLSSSVVGLWADSQHSEHVAVLRTREEDSMWGPLAMYYAASFRGRILLQFFHVEKVSVPSPWHMRFEHVKYDNNDLPPLYIRTTLEFEPGDLAFVRADGHHFGMATHRGTGVVFSHRKLLAFTLIPLSLYIFCVIAGSVHRRILPKPRPGFCQRCGYDLRASPLCCPECGADVSLVQHHG